MAEPLSKKSKAGRKPLMKPEIYTLNSEKRILSQYIKNDQYGIKETGEFSLNDENTYSLVCGEKLNCPVEEAEFYCKLITIDEDAKQLSNGVNGSVCVKYVQFLKLSYDMLLMFEATIAELYADKLEAIIFQNMDVQVFLKNNYENIPGYKIHFQDKRKVIISMELQVFQNLLKKKDAVKLRHDGFKEKLAVIKKKFKLPAVAIAGK